MNQPKEPMPFKVWCEVQANRIKNQIKEKEAEINQQTKKWSQNEMELLELKIRLSYYENKLNELKEREKQEKKGKKNSKKRE